MQTQKHNANRPVTIDMGVVSGRGLAAMDSNGKSDPLFSCKFYDHTTSKTKPKKKTLEPQWNEPKMHVLILCRLRKTLHYRCIVHTTAKAPVHHHSPPPLTTTTAPNCTTTGVIGTYLAGGVVLFG
jgi:Ca2+-dependent lipid-binding protein